MSATVFTKFRRLLYLVTPNETTFETVDEVPDVEKETVPLIIVFLCLEALLSFWRGDNRFRISDGITSLSAGIISRLPKLLSQSITVAAYIYTYKRWHIIELPWDSVWTWWLCFLGVDFGYYWFHRMAHEVNFMWAAHHVHHSSEDYNLAVGLRQSVLQGYTAWVFYLPMALAIPPPLFIMHNYFNLVFQFWIHTQYIKSLGPIEYILNTPSHHRVHHGRNPYCIDKNYGATLIIWDRLFGTFQAEGEEVVYGLVHPLNTFEAVKVQEIVLGIFNGVAAVTRGIIYKMISKLVAKEFGYADFLRTRIAETDGFLNKLFVLIKGPGWLPGKPRLGDPDDLPEIENPVVTYAPKVSVFWQAYSCVHFGVVVAVSQLVLAKLGILNVTMAVTIMGFMVYSLSCFGNIFDDRKNAGYMELLRCFGSLVITTLVHRSNLDLLREYDFADTALTVMELLYSVSIVLWVFLIIKNLLTRDESPKSSGIKSD